MVYRSIILYSLAAFLACSCAKKVEEQVRKKPNVLIILTDQQTNDCISYLGNPNLNTPAMDGLARSGVYFTQSYCTSPVCGPSRSSLITGRMPHETGVIWNATSISKKYPSVAALFSRAGYNTAWAGKWHLPQAYPAKQEIDSLDGFRMLPFISLQETWETGAATDEPIADAAINYIKEYEDNKPFLLAVSMHNPHDICFVPRNPENYKKWNDIDNLPALPPNFKPSSDEPDVVVSKRDMDHYGDELLKTKNYSDKDWQAYLFHYYRFAEHVDKQIGRILTELKIKGLDDNTIIVLTSDHGDGAAAHKWAAKLSFYEEPATVPLIISWRNKIPEGVIDRKQLVSGVDVVPTLCEYAGIKDAPAFTGFSLKKIIDHPDSMLRNHLVVELEDDKEDSTHHARMIRDSRFKYNIYSTGSNNESLYDMWKDPGEMQNLAYESNYAQIKEGLRSALQKWQMSTADTIKFNTRKIDKK